MGKPTGFLEFKREAVKYQPPLERINSFNEFACEMQEKDRRIQGARCMDCGIPFCHSGVMISGMASGCPINNLIPEWNDLIYRGLYREAFLRLKRTNNFPEFTGRVCPAPCEGSCTVGINDPQVTIKNNECFIIDRAYKEGWVIPKPPSIRTGKKVAVIGSGPAGLACADQLNKSGHSVTIFERADRPGGLLMYGIPNMKLDKSLVLKRINIMIEEGVEIRTDVEVGKNISAEQLSSEFDAIILCGGSTQPRDLNIEGRSLNGVHFAMEFLKTNTKSLLDSDLKDGNYISAKGKNVIVIGGGDTGTDCVATSIRHGANTVTQFEIMPKPPLERTPSNPWPEYPKILKTDYGQEEAIAKYGNDPREFSILTKKFVGDENGSLKEIHTVNVEWLPNDKGQFIPVDIPGSEKVWPAELALICMGFLGPEDLLIKKLGLEQDSRSNAKTNEGKYETNVKGIFVAGDMRRGQSLVVWAIKEGREAAKECDAYLMANE
jgi:glutamate synthase (NADPH/NADH) small chain